jgi:ribosome biogenesis GTPase / thiamine phosphate phosphatase
MSELSQGDSLVGTVLAVQANYYAVRLDSAAELLCTRRSRLKKIGQKVMVGDRVIVEEPDWAGQRGAISHVYDRVSELDRPPIANADQILLVFALAEPLLDPNQLSRFLVKAESTGLVVQLCLSKCDLVDSSVRQEWHDRLCDWGYQPIFLSVKESIGLDAVKERLVGRVTIVSGPSGVGKSSLINQMIPAVDLRVSAVSGKLGRGRHTTRHVELFELPLGGLLADSPGFNQPDLDCLPSDLALYFPEVRSRLAQGRCQFGDCSHRDEPGCGVRGDWERYGLYLLFLAEAMEREKLRSQQAEPDAVLKQKMRGKGAVGYEPRLDSKYREASRRVQKQSTQTLKGRVEDFLGEEE